MNSFTFIARCYYERFYNDVDIKFDVDQFRIKFSCFLSLCFSFLSLTSPFTIPYEPRASK